MVEQRNQADHGCGRYSKDLLSLVRFQYSLLKHENSQSTYKEWRRDHK